MTAASGADRGAMTAWCNWEHCPVIGRHRITIGVGCRASVDAGADQPTLRDQLVAALWAKVDDVLAARGVGEPDHVVEYLAERMADTLLPLIEPHMERAKAEAAAEARRGHSHTRWRNGDGPWQPDPCPADCPAITPPP